MKFKMDVYKKIKVFDGFEFNAQLKSEFQLQKEIHNHFFNKNQIKEQFISFSKNNFFFKLDEQTSSQESFEITNNSEFYHFKLLFLIKSKEFRVKPEKVEIKPKETLTISVIFNPLQNTMFHEAQLDVVITNENLNIIESRDLRKKNHVMEIQKKHINNCFLGNVK
jgi:hypothetical protein